VTIQAFCPAQISAAVDRKVVRNPFTADINKKLDDMNRKVVQKREVDAS
jgi:hypothetical protein